MARKTGQKSVFTISEGDRWFGRNRDWYESHVNKDDEIVQTLKFIELSPEKVLEIGCSNGAMLNLIKNAFGAKCWGIDPSNRAIEDGKRRFTDITFCAGTADSLPFEDNSFDTIVFGFCLYLCDRNDLFKIAYEADRCLMNEGTLIIKDFYPTFPYKNKYTHHQDMFSYKMDYSRMFRWNPAYTEVANIVFSHSGFALRDVPDEKVAVVVLRKSGQYAYPEEPFK